MTWCILLRIYSRFHLHQFSRGWVTEYTISSWLGKEHIRLLQGCICIQLGKR